MNSNFVIFAVRNDEHLFKVTLYEDKRREHYIKKAFHQILDQYGGSPSPHLVLVDSPLLTTHNRPIIRGIPSYRVPIFFTFEVSYSGYRILYYVLYN